MKPRSAKPRSRRAEKGFFSLDTGEGHAFLGRFDEAGLRAELRREGILAGLAARGYEDLVLPTSLEAGEHRLRLRPRGGRISLVDLRLEEVTTVVREPTLRGAGLQVLSVLLNTWLSLQDPRSRFSEDRPPLPGQRWPGLGLVRAFYALMTRWAREWGKDAVLATPEYFHNAVIYTPAFRFLSPAEQGRFEALRRDLSPLSVAAASFAVAEGRVKDLAAGRTLAWQPGFMAASVHEALAGAFQARAYADAVAGAREGSRFGLAPAEP